MTAALGCLVRAGDQVLLRDLRGAVSRAVSPSGTVVATAASDAFGVLRHGTGALAPAAVREAYGSDDVDGLKAFLAGRGMLSGHRPGDGPQKLCEAVCKALNCPGPLRRLRLCKLWCERVCNPLRPAPAPWESCRLVPAESRAACCEEMCRIRGWRGGACPHMCLRAIGGAPPTPSPFVEQAETLTQPYGDQRR